MLESRKRHGGELVGGGWGDMRNKTGCGKAEEKVEWLGCESPLTRLSIQYQASCQQSAWGHQSFPPVRGRGPVSGTRIPTLQGAWQRRPRRQRRNMEAKSDLQSRRWPLPWALVPSSLILSLGLPVTARLTWPLHLLVHTVTSSASWRNLFSI